MYLIQRRYSREQVKELLLWRDDRSLGRYLRLNQAAIEAQPDVDSAIAVLRSFL